MWWQLFSVESNNFSEFKRGRADTDGAEPNGRPQNCDYTRGEHKTSLKIILDNWTVKLQVTVE